MNIGDGAGAFAEGYKRHFLLETDLASGLAVFRIESIVKGDVGGGGFF